MTERNPFLDLDPSVHFQPAGETMSDDDDSESAYKESAPVPWTDQQLRHMALDFAMRAMAEHGAKALVDEAEIYLAFLSAKV